MYPAAGIPVWIFLGGLIGWLSGKIAHHDGYHDTMANLGVGALSAVLAGFVTAVSFGGEKNTHGFWTAIWVAAGAAAISLALFHTFYRGRSSTL